jgi:isocitrate/isopropylmalate dehydrogenase
MMLTHLEELEAAKRLQTAIEKVYADRSALTGDVGGKASTEEFTDGVIRAMNR